MFRLAVAIALVLCLTSGNRANDKPGNGQTSIESKLHGVWVGGPCMGEFTFRADGTFERLHYSPGDHKLKGTWQLEWKALPPTLVVDCKESTNPEFVGWVLTVDLVRLNDQEFAYQTPGDESVLRFQRKPQ